MRPILAAALILSLAAPALAESRKQREERCAAQSEIVRQAIEMRQQKADEVRVQEAILAGADERLAASVPILVGYVFSLGEDDLKQDVPAAFAEQCAAFKQ